MAYFRNQPARTLWALPLLVLGACGGGGGGENGGSLPPDNPPASTSVTLSALSDNTLYETTSVPATTSNGAGDFLFVGSTDQIATLSERRVLIRFDVAGGVPAGATVISTSLALTMNKTSTNAASNIELHRALRDWGEGTANAGANEGQGSIAGDTDATWTNTFRNGDVWALAGGQGGADYEVTAAAGTPVGGIGAYNWTSDTLRNQVQDMLDTPAANFGWFMIGDGGAKRFAARENGLASSRPELTVVYTP